MKTLNYLWRLFGTGLSFSFFGIGALILSSLFFPFFWLIIPNTQKRELVIKGLMQKTFTLFVNFMRFMGVMRVEVRGLEKIKDDQGCLIVANHPSLIDVVLLMSIYPQANCIIKKALHRNFFLKGAVKGAGYIPNDEGEDILGLCRQALQKGDSLVVFPEGTRTTPGKSMKMQRGAFHIALRAPCPVRLVHITVNPTTLTKSEAWYQIPDRQPLFSIQIGDKIEPENFPGQGLPASVGVRRLTRRVYSDLESGLPVEV